MSPVSMSMPRMCTYDSKVDAVAMCIWLCAIIILCCNIHFITWPEIISFPIINYHRDCETMAFFSLLSTHAPIFRIGDDM